MEYEQWNKMLGKRFNAMFKNYRKFSTKFLECENEKDEINGEKKPEELKSEEK